MFDTEDGPKTLTDLFDGRSQLITYHFMFGLDWEEVAPAARRSVTTSTYRESPRDHDVTWVAVSRALLEKLLAYRERMGWTFPWVSSLDNDFNFDYKVSSTEERPLMEYNFREVPGDVRAEISSEAPGMSSFAQRDGVVQHTYSAYARGLDAMWGMHKWLDRAPSFATSRGTGCAATTRTSSRQSRRTVCCASASSGSLVS